MPRFFFLMPVLLLGACTYHTSRSSVVVVTDATAAAKLPGFDGYEAAYVNFRMMASDVWSTAQAVKTLAALK